MGHKLGTYSVGSRRAGCTGSACLTDLKTDRSRMKTPPRKATPVIADSPALRDAVAVLVSSAELLARHVDRLSREKRDTQFAALLAAAAEVQNGIEILLGGGKR